MLISRRRATERASITLATLAQATTSRSATAAAQRFRRAREIADELLAQGTRERSDDPLLVALIPDRLMRAKQVLLRRLDRHAGFHPADTVVGVGLPLLIRIALERHPDLRVAGEVRFRREDSHDRAHHSVELQGLSQDVRSTSEAVAPDAFRDEHYRRPLRPVLFRKEVSSEKRLDAEDLAEIVRDASAVDPLGGGGGRKVEALPVPDRHSLEELRVLPPCVKVRIVDADDLEIPLRGRLVDEDEPLLVGERERAEE